MSISRREWMLASTCWSELLVLPETDTPGAVQAGAVYFIDAALAGFDHDQLAVYRQGLDQVASQTRQMFPPSTRFSDLSESQRTAVLKSIEKTEFFEKLRFHTILAYFGNPQFGWKLVGRDPAMHFEPPFGFYDAEDQG
jgi:gluconate 2-dehydrogenase gamma chain